MKSLSIGNEDFKVIRDSNCYYVDKTTMIGEILDNSGTRVFLFTRMRRFGKTFNMNIHHRSSDGFLQTIPHIRRPFGVGIGIC